MHLPTSLETRVRALGIADPRDPWPSARALDALVAAGARRDGSPRSVGAGAGPPLIAGQPLRWMGVDLEVECVCDRSGRAESNLVAPPWDELIDSESGEEEWWELVDAFCAAVDARHGAIVDGEAVDPEEPTPATLTARLRRHLAVLVPAHLATRAHAAACVYAELPRSGLVVLLR